MVYDDLMNFCERSDRYGNSGLADQFVSFGHRADQDLHSEAEYLPDQKAVSPAPRVHIHRVGNRKLRDRRQNDSSESRYPAVSPERQCLPCDPRRRGEYGDLHGFRVGERRGRSPVFVYITQSRCCPFVFHGSQKPMGKCRRLYSLLQIRIL